METTFVELLQAGNDFDARVAVAKAEMISYVIGHIDDAEIEKIALWSGKRVTDDFDDEGYCKLCSTICHRATNYDPGCSNAMYRLYAFVSEAAQLGYKFWKIRLRDDRLTKADALEKEAARLREEVRLEDTGESAG